MEFLRSRQLRSGSYSALYVGVFAGILVAANWLGVQYNETFDFTEQRLYSLSDQTHRVLDGLDRDVTMSYFDRTAQFVAARDMLQRYENASSRVRVEYVDPDQDPIKTEAMNVKSYGTLVIDVGGASQQASSTSEQDITNTIIAALKGEEKTACVVTGHGESASDDMERDGFYSARDEIEGANYQFEDVNLGTDGVPGHCTVLVIPGPSTDLFEPEVDALRGYVSQGGRALVMLRPAFPDQRGRRDEPSPKLVALLAEWGIAARNDVVIDESAIGQLFGGGPFTPLVTDYLYHPIVEPMENVATLFPRARTVEKAEGVPGRLDPRRPLRDVEFQLRDRYHAHRGLCRDSRTRVRAACGSCQARGRGDLRRPGRARRRGLRKRRGDWRHRGRGRAGGARRGGGIVRLRLQLRPLAGRQPRPAAQHDELAHVRRGPDLDPASRSGGHPGRHDQQRHDPRVPWQPRAAAACHHRDGRMDLVGTPLEAFRPWAAMRHKRMERGAAAPRPKWAK